MCEFVSKQLLAILRTYRKLARSKHDVRPYCVRPSLNFLSGSCCMSVGVHSHPPQIRPQPPLTLPPKPRRQRLPRLAQHPMHRRRRHHLPP